MAASKRHHAGSMKFNVNNDFFTGNAISAYKTTRDSFHVKKNKEKGIREKTGEHSELKRRLSALTKFLYIHYQIAKVSNHNSQC